ncbi:hypothetical protein DYB37_005962, partial [Aphanomyces astaci]
GNRPKVLTPENIDLAQSWVEFDAQITLQEMKDRLMLELGINVSKTTHHRELDKRVFTYKTVHYEPHQMNDPPFKDKRVEYVVAFRELMGQAKIPIWIDETNFNLFTCRTKARSRRGTRAVFEEAEFDSATLLRLSSYSPMFNPIENLWSEFKAHVKTHLRERLAAFMGPPPDGLTREEFRMQYLEHVAQEVIQGIDIQRLNRYALRLEYFYGRAERMEDMEVGM